MAESHRYYLQFGVNHSGEGWESEEREYIDHRLSGGAEVLALCYATCWLDAADRLAPNRDRPGARR